MPTGVIGCAAGFLWIVMPMRRTALFFFLVFVAHLAVGLGLHPT